MFNWSLLVWAVNGLDVVGWTILLLWAVVGFDHVYGWCCYGGLTSFSGPACERCSVSKVSGTHLLPTFHPPTHILYFTLYLWYLIYISTVSGTHLLPTHLLVHSLMSSTTFPSCFTYLAFYISHFMIIQCVAPTSYPPTHQSTYLNTHSLTHWFNQLLGHLSNRPSHSFFWVWPLNNDPTPF